MDSGVAMWVGGNIFLDKYRIEGQIGCGGMGTVYAATDVALDRKVAIKVLLPEIAASPLIAARFVKEGRAAARVGGEHVARVFDAGRTPEGLPYMVLEYLDGVDLETFLQQRGKLPVAEAVDILLQALEGVAEVHRHGIVHRDLKPANLFLHRQTDGTRVVKVLDFGVSKTSGAVGDDPEEPELTVTRTLLGSPAYMSPEQLYDSKRVDARTDIWSLGVILYEMLAGAAPFEEKSLSDLVVAILHKVPPPLQELRPDIPPELERILESCLHRDREHRIGSATDLATQLAPIAFRSSGVHVHVPEPAPVPVLEPAPDLECADTVRPDALPELPPPSSMDIETRVWQPAPPSNRFLLPFYVVMVAAFAVMCAAALHFVHAKVPPLP